MKVFQFMTAMVTALWLTMFSSSALSEEAIIDGALNQIDYDLRQLTIGKERYRIASTALIILEDGAYGSLDDVYAGAGVRVWLSDASDDVVKLKVHVYP